MEIDENTADNIRWMPPGAQKRIARREYQRMMREKTIDAYGAKCACCGYDDRRFLCVDHVFNDGAEHRRSFGSSGGIAIHEYLFANGYPKDRFQLLCYNCNCAKQFNITKKGVCPHKQ